MDNIMNAPKQRYKVLLTDLEMQQMQAKNGEVEAMPVKKSAPVENFSGREAFSPLCDTYGFQL